MERCLGLMAGAGVLPGHAASEARRQGWRVIAFAFDEAPGLAESAQQVIPSSVTDIRTVLHELAARRAEAAVFVGKFWKRTVFAHADRTDAAGRRLAERGLSDEALIHSVVATLSAMGIDVLDQRLFLGPWLLRAAALTARRPSEAEWEDIRGAVELARHLARYGIGQTVVRSRGVTVAVEAAEGTDETIRRGTALAGAGAVVVKTVAPGHDYRFDVPTVGPATLAAMAAGGATVLAVARDRVLAVDREEVVRLAEAAGIAVVTIDGEG